MDRVRDRIKVKHYSGSTESTYCHWILRYILFHHKRHPAEMGKPEIEAYRSRTFRHMALTLNRERCYGSMIAPGNCGVSIKHHVL